jgi:hypothetical protein
MRWWQEELLVQQTCYKCVLGFGKRDLRTNNSNEMMARGVVGTTNITCIVRVIDVGKMVKYKH